MADKKYYKRCFLLCFVILGLILFIILFAPHKNKFNGCNEIYLNVCFDNQSIFYRCNLNKEICSIEEWEIVSAFKFMEENRIIIYGNSHGKWCMKELLKFKDFAEDLKHKKLYIDCSLKQDTDKCKKIFSTPT